MNNTKKLNRSHVEGQTSESKQSRLRNEELEIFLFVVYALVNLIYVIGLFGFLLPFLISATSTVLVTIGALLIFMYPITVLLGYTIFKMITKDVLR